MEQMKEKDWSGLIKLWVKERFKNIREWSRTEDGILIWLLVFSPLGCYLLWKYGKNRRIIKIIGTIGLVLSWGVFLEISGKEIKVTDQLELAEKSKSTFKVNFEATKQDYKDLQQKYDNLDADKTKLEKINNEFSSYKEKMKPYESLSEADTKKREGDANAAQKVTDQLKALPTVDNVKVTDQEKINTVKKLFDSLTDEQKKLVDATPITELNEKIKQLIAEEKAAAEKKAAEEKVAAEKKAQEEAAAAKQAEEEAKGYETGITYDQLARTPDNFFVKKVKFSGKVIQVMEGDEITQLRLAVDGDYDKIIYCEYDSTLVTSRVLEDDNITVLGISMGLYSYKSTMGGTITIPSMTVDKIEQ